MIFDNSNDIVYCKYDKRFSKYIRKVGKEQRYILDDKDDDDVDPDVLLQMFSVLIASQRIMNTEFGNSYTSVQCGDGINMVFDEYLEYLFVYVGTGDISCMQQTLGVCVTVAKHLCGPNINMLKRNKNRALLLSRLVETWTQLKDCDQAFLVEAVEQLMVNDDLTAASLKALQDAVDKLKTVTEFSRIHAMLLVENKFLSLYSSKNSQELSAADIMFLSLLCESFYMPPTDTNVVENTESEESSGDEFYSPQASPQGSPAQIRKEYPKTTEDTRPPPHREEIHIPTIVALDGEYSDGVISQIALLTSGDTTYNPHVIHICSIVEGVLLLLMFEIGNVTVCTGLYETFQSLNSFVSTQQRETDMLKYTFDNVETGIKKVFEGLKKTRHMQPEVENCQRKLHNKWEYVRKKYQEFSKSSETQVFVKLEAGVPKLRDFLKELSQLTFFDSSVVSIGRDAVLAVSGTVKHRLSDFSEFLKVKALRNFTLGSRASLTINKYLEEFPGLVHFLYIDRSNHRITAPSLDFNSEETTSLTKRKIWAMVEFTRNHLQEGHTAVMWKDTTFNYAYFLWFEDSSAAPLKPKVPPSVAIKSFPRPGILNGDFYKKLVDVCFPKTSSYKIHCYELYCIHLGLATSTCVLEQSRRLAATIWEVTGMPNNPIDLL